MTFENETQLITSFSNNWIEVEAAVKIYFSGVIFNKSDVPDLVQRTAICAFRKYSAFDPAKSFRAWVMGIACYEALAYMRDHRREKVVFNSEVSDVIAAVTQQEEEAVNHRSQLLRKVMTMLPEQSRMILDLHYRQRLPLEQVAARLGMGEGALRTALCRLRVKMREMILDLERRDDSGEETK